MVKTLDFRLLSRQTKAELYQVMGIEDHELEWLRENGKPVVLLEFADRRKISREQQKKAHVLLTAIGEWQGGTPQEVAKDITKTIFLGDVPTLAEWFSLSDCTMETARDYITYLIEFCLVNGIPCREPMYKLTDDMYKYVWACCLNKKCAVCGRNAELHHIDAVGMGRNRKEVCHIGMRCLPLCREHHTEIHRIGKETFLQTYHLEPVTIDERIAKTFKLRGGNKNGS